jgi:hypothetical protein
VLPEPTLAGVLQDQPYPLHARVAQPGEQRTSATDLWQALDNRVRPSLSYVVTLALDPQIVFTSPMVFTRTSRVRSSLDADGQAEEFIYPRPPRAAATAERARPQPVEDASPTNKSHTSRRRPKS